MSLRCIGSVKRKISPHAEAARGEILNLFTAANCPTFTKPVDDYRRLLEFARPEVKPVQVDEGSVFDRIIANHDV